MSIRRQGGGRRPHPHASTFAGPFACMAASSIRTSICLCSLPNHAAQLRGNKLMYVLSPSIQSLLTFRHEIVPLVYGSNARDRAGLVVEDLVGDVRRNTKPSHAGDTCPAQVMKTPISNLRKLVELSFGMTEPAKWHCPSGREYIRPSIFIGFEEGYRLTCQMDEMNLSVLCACFR